MTVAAPRAHSLKWRLIRRLLTLQAALLSLLIVLIIAALYFGGHLLNFESEDVTIDALKNAVSREADGSLAVRETPELIALRATVPDLWYILRDRQGRGLMPNVPAEDVVIESIRRVEK